MRKYIGGRRCPAPIASDCCPRARRALRSARGAKNAAAPGESRAPRALPPYPAPGGHVMGMGGWDAGFLGSVWSVVYDFSVQGVLDCL